MASASEEKRKFFRHPIRAPIKIFLQGKTENLDSETTDLSLGGLSFFTRERLKKGAALRIEIPVKDKAFSVTAKVVHTREDLKRGGRHIGVCFADAPSAFRAKLAEEALEILEYRKALSRHLGYDVTEEEAAEKWIRLYADRFVKNAGTSPAAPTSR